MKSLEDSITTAMDGSDAAILPHLPYILQDLWEIGSDPETMIHLIRKHGQNRPGLTGLDLGCGKGAVSVRVAHALRYPMLGIDGVADFIRFAGEKAAEFGVSDLCRFETADIRTRLSQLNQFDFIVLGSIGPVLGDYRQTLGALAPRLRPQGFIIIDDGYIDDSSNYTHPLIQQKSRILDDIAACNMRVTETRIAPPDDIRDSDNDIFAKITHRCHELMTRFPDQKELFADYIRRQEAENDVLENKITCAALVIQPRPPQ